MGFLQLYYTSCEHGLSGYSGFQFNAVSPGVDARLMREVEQLTAYRRPQCAEPGAEPVNLCHAVDAVSGVAVTAQVVYAGTDPSGRPGNYFVHALATAEPAHDLDGLLPVELWGSAAWNTRPTASTELAVLHDPPEPGAVDRMAVAAHLEGAPDGAATAALLLTATVAAMDGVRPVVIRSATTDQNVLWIAAVGYLLEERMARRMSFATYAGRPDRSGVHLAGTLPDPEADAAIAGQRSGLHVVDTVSGDRPAIDVHAAATLLATVGPIRARGMWHRARQLASGAERTLDEWHPVLAAVQLLGGDLPAVSAGTLDSVASWLTDRAEGPQPLSAEQAGAVLRVVLERAGELTAARLRSMAEVKWRAQDQDQVDVVEQQLAARAHAAFASGRMPDPVTDPVTDRGRAAVTAAAHIPLENATSPAEVLDVLEWAHRAGVTLPADTVETVARDRLGPALDRLDVGRLIEICSHDTEVKRDVVGGIAESLASGTGSRAIAALRGEVGPLLDGADLSRYPRLHEFVLLDQVSRGDASPLAAVAEIAELRSASDDPLRDESVLRQLWPKHSWTINEAIDLVPRLGAEPGPALPYLTSPLLHPPRLDDRLDRWLRLVDCVLEHPAQKQLDEHDRARLRTVRGLGDDLRRAQAVARRLEHDWHVEVGKAIEAVDRTFRPPLRARFAELVLEAPKPASALSACAEQAFVVCLDRVGEALGAEPRDHVLATRLVIAAAELRQEQRYPRFTVGTLAPRLAAWSPRDLRAVRSRLGKTRMPVPLHLATAAKEAHGPVPGPTGRFARLRSSFGRANGADETRTIRDFLDALVEFEQADADARRERR